MHAQTPPTHPVETPQATQPSKLTWVQEDGDHHLVYMNGITVAHVRPHQLSGGYAWAVAARTDLALYDLDTAKAMAEAELWAQEAQALGAWTAG